MGAGAPGFVRPFKQAIKSMAAYISISELSVYLKTFSCLILRRIAILQKKYCYKNEGGAAQH